MLESAHLKGRAQVWCRTDKGLKRETNQDSFLVNQDLGLYIVADGMGGHLGGEVASSLAVKTAEEIIMQFKNNTRSPRDLITLAFNESCKRIFDLAERENPKLAGMGTTMVLAYEHGGSLYFGNVGDSRAYLFRQEGFWQLTEDHSLVNEQLRAGLIREDEVKRFVGRNVITRSVGFEREVNIDILERPIQYGDFFLLCSDGLSGLVSDFRMSQIVQQNDPENFVNDLINEALSSGGDDNVTAIILKYL